MDIIDYHIGEDILKGEDVPFFILWEGRIDQLDLKITGFDGINEFHNVKNTPDMLNENSFVITDILTPGYFGCILRTPGPDSGPHEGTIECTLYDKDQEKSISIKCPFFGVDFGNKHNLKGVIAKDRVKTPIDISIRGKATICVEIDEPKEKLFYFPEEIEHAIIKFINLFQEGLEGLRPQYPEKELFFNLVMPEEPPGSETEYMRLVQEEMDKHMDDENFKESIRAIMITSFAQSFSGLDRLLKPLLDYFSSRIGDKVFLFNPLQHIRLQPGLNKTKINIEIEDVLHQSCGSFNDIIVEIDCDKDYSLPLYSLINFTREGYNESC